MQMNLNCNWNAVEFEFEMARIVSEIANTIECEWIWMQMNFGCKLVSRKKTRIGIHAENIYTT